jgi:hypothetical protein
MAEIKATIKTSPIGKWYIELEDEINEKKEYCLDFYEFEEKLSKMGEEFGGHMEVIWSAEENVTKEQINEIRMEMKAYEARIAEEDKLNSNPFGTPENSSGFNPNE